ncbi:hypothetical protein OH76DRAFT_641801 [Lentinus brumalis]|uniref:Uncharacterized protein n=1 Tax=Lentinus brumalis TaxID=2498619 RepID=A0A371D7S3_9APHY|nr:hypothetical protein OH76DRAFT_641801 [Polyporus brumalis]
MRRFPKTPEMQQRFKRSYAAGDPEAHMPLLDTEAIPPLPPKTETAMHHRNLSSMDWTQTHQRNDGSSRGGLNEWETKVRGPPSRVPVPPMFPEPMVFPQQRYSLHHNTDTAMAMPEPEPAPAPRSPLFHLPQFSFPRLQIKTDGKKGRIPSLRIEFMRESNQVVSSPAEAASEWTHVSHPPASSVSAPSTIGRPFATMAASPLPEIPRLSSISTIDITRASPSLPPSAGSTPQSAVNSVVQSDVSTPGSIDDVGVNLFSRKLSTEGTSFQTVSRNSSAQAVSRTSSVRPISDPGRPKRNGSVSSGSSGSGISAGGRGANLRRATTWVPNVFASYSPWHGVVPGTGEERSREPLESPTGQLRIPDGYRPMPTLEETPEATPATIPTPLPGDLLESPSYLAEDPLPLPPQLAAIPSSRPPEALSQPAEHPPPPAG